MFTPKSIEFKTSAAKKIEGRHCCAYHCKNKPHPRKGGLCSTHYSTRCRIRDPIYDRYKNFKNNATKRRNGEGIEFTVTLYQFWWFCILNDYIIKPGRRGRKCTIDRIRNYEGYHIENLQILTNDANIKKYHGVDKHVTELPVDHEDYCPF